MTREVLPFWVLSLAGLARRPSPSSVVSSATSRVERLVARVALPVANLSVFAALWLVQFVVLDRVIFPTPSPNGAMSHAAVIVPPADDDPVSVDRAARSRPIWPGPVPDAAVARSGPRTRRGCGPRCSSLLASPPVLYLWGLGASGWANAYYSAAVQAGTKSWKAFFFGSTDASNFITVDKSPASLWVMEISARIFGVNSWSMLVPQALEGVATVGVLYATVKRWFSPAAGLDRRRGRSRSRPSPR